MYCKLTFEANWLFAPKNVDKVERLAQNLVRFYVRDAKESFSVVITEKNRLEWHANLVRMRLVHLLEDLDECFAGLRFPKYVKDRLHLLVL